MRSIKGNASMLAVNSTNLGFSRLENDIGMVCQPINSEAKGKKVKVFLASLERINISHQKSQENELFVWIKVE